MPLNHRFVNHDFLLTQKFQCRLFLPGRLQHFLDQGSSRLDVAATLGALRAAGLWSDTEAKTVPDEHRQAYKDQLVLVDCARFGGASGFIIARFDHPKFPSDAERWDAWRVFFTQHHGAAE